MKCFNTFFAHCSCRVTEREGDWVTAGGGILNALSSQRVTPGTEGIGEFCYLANAPKWSKQASDQIRSDHTDKITNSETSSSEQDNTHV